MGFEKFRHDWSEVGCLLAGINSALPRRTSFGFSNTQPAFFLDASLGRASGRGEVGRKCLMSLST
jgi:hypothetical protein